MNPENRERGNAQPGSVQRGRLRAEASLRSSERLMSSLTVREILNDILLWGVAVDMWFGVPEISGQSSLSMFLICFMSCSVGGKYAVGY